MVSVNPNVAVLLPSYNGAKYIEAQIASILQTTGANVHIFLHDDGSTDDTLDIVRRFGKAITVLDGPSQGGAAQNVFFLMCNAPWEEYDYISLADQDDVWHPEKLSTAISYLEENALDCYSSDVTAFWPDGRTSYVRKSQALRDYDCFFEGGGPGNTHVYTQRAALFIKSSLDDLDVGIRRRIKFHDWFFYALCRSNGLKWGIHFYSGLQYRQHDVNVIGASNGLAAAFFRLKQLFGSGYFDQVALIAKAVHREFPIVVCSKASRLRQVRTIWAYRRELRRKRIEGAILTFALMLRILVDR